MRIAVMTTLRGVTEKMLRTVRRGSWSAVSVRAQYCAHRLCDGGSGEARAGTLALVWVVYGGRLEEFVVICVIGGDCEATREHVDSDTVDAEDVAGSKSLEVRSEGLDSTSIWSSLGEGSWERQKPLCDFRRCRGRNDVVLVLRTSSME